MKKRTKIILFIVVLLLILIPIGLYLLTMYESYTFTIVEIDGNRIMAVRQYPSYYSFSEGQYKIKNEEGNDITFERLQIGDIIYVEDIYSLVETDKIGADYACVVMDISNGQIQVAVPDIHFYNFSLENASVKNENGHSINYSELKVGDTVTVVEKKDAVQTDLATIHEGHSVDMLDTVTSIKIVEQDVNDLVAYTTRNRVATKRAIIVTVNENSIEVRDIEDNTDIFNVSFAEDGNIGFSEGQEVLIYFNGRIDFTPTKTIENVDKIQMQERF